MEKKIKEEPVEKERKNDIKPEEAKEEPTTERSTKKKPWWKFW